MHVMAISTVSQGGAFWDALKRAYGQLPESAEWLLAVASSDGTRAVNIIVADSTDTVSVLLDEHAGSFATTECFELDAANAVGLSGAGTRDQAREPPQQPVDDPLGHQRTGPAPKAPARTEPRRGGRRGEASPGTVRMRERLSELIAAHQIPSAQVGVLRDGEIADFAVGVRDVRSGAAATTDTVYQIGSMTKTWTALAFMQLVDEGRLALDEPVRAYLPGFRVADPLVSAALTPRQLLNHTNGIEELYGDPGEGEDVYERMVANIAEAPQVFPLGETHGYSAALGYAILARIMEVADGRRWDAVLRARLFEPLGLTGTASWHGELDPARAATGHVIRSLDEGPVVAPVPFLPRAYGPGGTITSTARDVLTMASLFLDGGRTPEGRAIVSPRSIREMTHSRVPIPDPFTFGPWWGLGLIVCDWHGETVFAHDGSTIGQNARLRILPERNLAVAMLTNAGPRDRFYREAFDSILAELGAPRVPELPRPDPGVPLDVHRYTGTYARPGASYEVGAVGGGLRLTLVRDAWQARVAGQPERTTRDLLPIDEAHFLAPAAGPLDDAQTVALYGARAGRAQYLHTNSRLHPRVGEPTAEDRLSR